jgi:glycosyltransferase involved in cell wall biosynthesis
MMRVGIIVYGLERRLTGIGRYTIELVRALSQQSADLVLLTCGGAGELASLSLETVVLKGSYFLPGLMSAGQLQLSLLIHHLRLDVLHDTTGMMPFLFPMGKTRLLTTIYDVIPWSHPGISTKWDTLIYRYWHPHIVPRVDAIATISETSRNDIVRHLPIAAEKVHNVYSGITSNYQPASPETVTLTKTRYQLPERYILYVGNLEERKNLQRVLYAYKQLKEEGLPHKLVLVGPQKWKYEGIFKVTTELRLENDVIFTGYISVDDLPALYSGADVFVYPSLYEGFGLPVLEAMACGTPVVTSNISSLPEIAGDAALLVDPYNIQQIVSAIRQILLDHQIQADLRQRGVEQAKKFTWNQTASQIIDVYDLIMRD